MPIAPKQQALRKEANLETLNLNGKASTIIQKSFKISKNHNKSVKIIDKSILNMKKCYWMELDGISYYLLLTE